MRGSMVDALPPHVRGSGPRDRYATWKRDRHARSMVNRYCVPPPPHRWAAFGRSIVVPPARIENADCISIGDGVVVLENVWMSVVRHFPDITPRVVIEDMVRMGRCCQLSIAEELIIERGAIIGDFVQIGDTFHPYDAEGDRLLVLTRPEPVRICKGAILGSHVIVLPGVTVGPGAYVDHHSVVNSDVPAGTVVAGNPARVVS
ncbi:MAG: acyltransferase [Actinomycetes bacterium]